MKHESSHGILTKKALAVIDKKLRGKKLSQQDSNYLSRFVRPKLRLMSSINAEELLRKLEYNPESIALERKLRKIIIECIPDVDSIIICGSAIQTNYKEYNDLDLIVATKKSLDKQKKKEIEKKATEAAKKQGINLDIQIYARDSIISQYSNNPSLIYQLKDSKVIYGDIRLPSKISLSNIDLKMKLDWSEDIDISSDASEIYLALRNSMLVRLLMNKKIDNYLLKEYLINILGNELINKLKTNKASIVEKKLALSYLNLLNKHLEEELSDKKWEKIEIENL